MRKILIICDECNDMYSYDYTTGNTLTDKLRKQGWDVGAYCKEHVCPECSHKHKRKENVDEKKCIL